MRYALFHVDGIEANIAFDMSDWMVKNILLKDVEVSERRGIKRKT